VILLKNKEEFRKEFAIGFFVGFSACGTIAAVLLAVFMM
jgi:hypothetical protein